MKEDTRHGDPRQIPLHALGDTPVPWLFVKRILSDGRSEMRSYPHRDDYYMIVLITAGEATVSVDFKDLVISAGEAVLVSPEQIHAPSAATGGVEGWLLAIASEHFSEQEAELAARYSLNPAAVRLSRDDAADAETLFGILTRHSGSYPVAIPLAESIKRIILHSLSAGAPRRDDRYVSIVVRLKELLAENLVREKKPSAYAAMLNLSPVYLNEAVRAVTGKSAGSFIRGQIVLRAKRQLVYTSLSAQEIAFGLGYDDFAYFSRMFKKETSLSPTQYRKTSKNTSNS